MAGEVQGTENGAILDIGNGILGECCCGPSPAACGGDPSCWITVTGADAKLPLKIGNTTWVPSTTSPLGANEVYSGTRVDICPGQYQKGQYTTTYGPKYGVENWKLGQQIGTKDIPIDLSRFADFTPTTAYFYIFQRRRVEIGAGDVGIGFFGRDVWFKEFYPPYGTTSFSVCNIGIDCGAKGTSYSDYSIRDQQFGSYSQSGVTVTWERGYNW